MFDDPGEGDLTLGVVDHGIALEVVFFRKDFCLKAQGPVFQRPVALIEILIDQTGIKDPAEGVLSHAEDAVFLCDRLLEIRSQLYRDILQDLFHQGRVAANGNALIGIVEIIVVKGKAHGKSSYNKSGKLPAVPAPLLLGITLDQLFIDIASCQRKGLFLQVPGFVHLCLGHLSVDDGLCLCGRLDIPHPAEGIHIERKVVQFLSVSGHRAVDIVVELGELSDIIPDLFVGGMENMGAVAVHLNAVHLFGINISCNVVSSVDHKAGPAGLFHLSGKNGAEKAGTNDQIIIMHTVSIPKRPDPSARSPGILAD